MNEKNTGIMEVFVSNHLTNLASILKKELFQGTLFTQRILILPSKHIKSWLVDLWSDDSMDIVTGFQTFSLEEAVQYLLRLIQEKEIHFPTSLEMKILIYQQLQNAAEKSSHSFSPLIDYLSIETKKRSMHLANILSDLFYQYGRYATDLLPLWENPKDWQQSLFHKIFYELSYTYPLKELPLQKISIPHELKIYIFGFSFIPELYFDFFHQLSKHCCVKTFYLRPTKEYWEDLISPKEKKHLQSKIASFQDPLQDWIYEMCNTNQILAGWGTLGKRFEKILGNYDLIVHEDYQENEQSTLLHALQNDILNLTELRDDKPRQVEEKDISLCIQPITGTKWLEVTTLFENIHKVLSMRKIPPSEILVLAPDINEYFPYIQTVFGRENGSIDYKVSDIDLFSLSFLARGLMQIFNLIGADWSLKEIFEIIDNPLVRKKFSFSQDNLDQFREILKLAKVRFAFSPEHKEEIMGLKDKAGTFEEAVEKILLSFATHSVSFANEHFSIPFGTISQTEINLVVPFFHVICSLWEDISIFREKQDWALSTLTDFLLHIRETYFHIEENPIENAAVDLIKSFSKKLRSIHHDTSISFEYFKTLLHDELQKKKVAFQNNYLDAVQFSSLTPDGMIPSRCIFLLGMTQDAYPLKEKKNSLNLLRNYYPKNSQKDRYLFFQSLLYASDLLWISYPKQSNRQDISENLPSALLEELMDFLKRYYRVNQLSYEEWVKKTLTLHLKPIKEKIFFKKKFFAKLQYPYTSLQDLPVEVSIYEMQFLTKNPIGFYLWKKHGIELEYTHEEGLEDFFLSPINKEIYIQSHLLHEQRNERKLQAELPKGIFKEIAENQLFFELHTYQQKIKDFGLCHKDLLNIELKRNCQGMRREKSKLILPALKINLEEKKIWITGTIRNVHTKGLILFKENKPLEWIKSWPIILIYRTICSKNMLEFAPCLYFVKSGSVEDISFLDVRLKEFLSYYLISKQTMSPFSKIWIPSLLKEDYEAYKKTLSTSLRGKYGLQNPYERWFFSHFEKMMTKSLFEQWSKYLRFVFSPPVS